MKKYFFSIVCLCAGVVLMGCHKDDDDVTSAVSSANATVENGSSFSSKIDNVAALMDADIELDEETGHYNLTGYVVANGQYKDGGFTISLPETVDSKYLSVLVPVTGITISDPSAESGNIDIFVAYKSDNITGSLYYATYPPTIEPLAGTDATYVFVDRDVKITGSGSGKTNDGYTVNYSYNLLYKKGWNIMYATWSESPETKIGTVAFTNSAPSGMKWYFTGDQSKSATMVKSAMATGSIHKSLFKQLN